MQNFILLFLLISPLSYSKENLQKNTKQDVVAIQGVVVYGVRSGPGLWKVSKQGHSLWILGTLSPLPKKMTWESLEVESVIHDSQAYLLAPSFTADIGFFQGLSLATSAIGIKKNPDKKKLKDVVPADIYARWLVLKKKYLGRNNAIEKTRPIFASGKLFAKAINKIGLTYKTKIEKKVRKLAKKSTLEFINPTIKIDLNRPKDAIKKFKKTEISDLECFTKTLDRLESDLTVMRLRAEAWANGNVEKLTELTYPNQNKSCNSAILNNDIAKDVGLENIENRLRKIWQEKAQVALANYQSTFALLPISYLIGSNNNYLTALEQQGYTIEAPE